MNLQTLCCLSATLILGVAACDPADATLESPPQLASEDELDALLDYCADLQAGGVVGVPADIDALDITSVPDVAEGVCSAGHEETAHTPLACGTCDFTPGVAGYKFLHYARWCYDPPSPPSCPACESWQYTSYSCLRC